MRKREDKTSEPAIPSRLTADPERILALLLGYLKLAALIAAVVFIASSWDDLRMLLPRISHLEAVGVKIDIDRLASDLRRQPSDVSAENRFNELEAQGVISRALRVRAVFEGAKILWIDDNPAANIPFRRILRNLGAYVETARDSDEAIKIIGYERFDLTISDINRGSENGVDALPELIAAGMTARTIFYVLTVKPELPMPKNALGIASRSDDLLNLVIDGLERARWSTPEVVSQDVSRHGNSAERE